MESLRASAARSRLIRRATRLLSLTFILFLLADGALRSASAHQAEWLGAQVAGAEQAAMLAEQAAQQISTVEWLAPLAPIALSPFFGITMLAGLACYGPQWLPDNALLSAGSPLANPVVFWVFLGLTLLTSVPRLSKVSKPAAQLADFIETYSAIIILAVVKVMAYADSAPAGAIAPAEAGMLGASWQGLLLLATAANIIVVNTVKFFFEFLVWITPIPFLDACFEAANKLVCLGLMALYAFNPVAALAVNGLIFLACALIFGWARRRELFYRSMLVGWVLSMWRKPLLDVNAPLEVYPFQPVGAIPARARCFLTADDAGWTLTCPRWLRSPLIEPMDGASVIKSGWWINTIYFQRPPADSHVDRFDFSCRLSPQLVELAEALGATFDPTDEADDAAPATV